MAIVNRINGRRIYELAMKNKAYILAFFLPAVLLLASYALFEVYPFGKNSVLALDLNAQYVYYYDYMYDVFAGKESLFYCWSRSFSGEFFGTFAYYLASPFNFIVWLFPRTAITEGLLTMIIAKASAVGLCGALYLKKRRGFSDLTTVLFSLMFALGGYFAAHSINPMWLDGLIALPLVLWGVELICDRGSFLLYTISLLYIFIANYYIGYMVGIFSALYFAYYIASGRTARKSGAGVGRSVLVYGMSSLAAVMMSCPVIIPAFNSLQLGKLGMGDPDYSLRENFNLTDALLKLFPATFDTIRPEGLPMIYCGTLTLVFAAVYFTLNKIPLRQRIAGGGLFAGMLLSMYVTPADMFWHGGRVPIWMPYRYAFILSFLLIIFGAEAFENIKSVKRKTLGGVFAAILALLLIADHYGGCDYFDTKLIIVIPMLVTAVICGSILLFKKYRRFRGMKIALLALVCLELVMNNLITFNKMDKDIVYSSRESYLGDIPKTRAVADMVKEQDSGFYRMEKTYHRCVNDAMAAGLYGVSHSSSAFNAKAIEFASLIGYGAREHYSRYDGATPVTDDIFGVKYVLSKSELLAQYDKKVDIPEVDDIKVYENSDALGIAYLAHESMIGSEISDESPFAVQERMAARLSNKVNKLWLPADDYFTDYINVDVGSTTDAHASYKRRVSGEDSFVVYRITPEYSGRLYMYLPTDYERECKLFVNGEFIKYYFENENHSIAYLGNFRKGDTVEVKLELLEDDCYYKAPQFRSLDQAALDSFNKAIAEMNKDTAVTRTAPASLEITVNAEQNRCLFTSIPYEPGWSAKIDGETVELSSSANKMFIALKVPEGEHTIELSFHTPGMKTGLIMALCGVVMLASMIVIACVLKPRRTDNTSEENNG